MAHNIYVVYSEKTGTFYASRKDSNIKKLDDIEYLNRNEDAEIVITSETKISNLYIVSYRMAFIGNRDEENHIICLNKNEAYKKAKDKIYDCHHGLGDDYMCVRCGSALEIYIYESKNKNITDKNVDILLDELSDECCKSAMKELKLGNHVSFSDDDLVIRKIPIVNKIIEL